MIDNLFSLDINTGHIGTKGESSTGLGLIIRKYLIEKHNDTLLIEPAKSKGSAFSFTIYGRIEARNKAENNTSGSVDMLSDPGKKLNILIAEDDETSDLLISIALAKISRKFYHAKNGLEAIDICHSHPDIDLILMNIQMPEMDGFEATRRIRLFNKDVIIIAQTACIYSNDRVMSLEAGCNDYISKPVNQLELMKLIRKHIK
jgi:CheY-like chemotaxis protein